MYLKMVKVEFDLSLMIIMNKMLLKDVFSSLNIESLLSRAKNLVVTSEKGIKDVAISMVPQFVNLVTGFFTAVLIARGLGATEMGKYALIMSVSAIALTISDLGLGQTAIHYASYALSLNNQDWRNAILRWAFRLRIAIVLVVTVVFVAVSPLLASKVLHDKTLIPYLWLGLTIGVFLTVGSVPTIYFQSIKKFGVNATVISIQKIVVVIGIVAVSVMHVWSLLNVLVVTIIGAAIGAAIFMFLVPKKTLISKDDKVSNYFTCPSNEFVNTCGQNKESMGNFAFYQVLSTIIVMIIVQADVWFIGHFLKKDQVGIYSVASRFTLPLTILLNGLNTALWPRAAGVVDAKSIRKLLRKTFVFSAAVAGAGILYAIITPSLIPLLFGTEYSGSVILGQLLCFRYCLALLVCPVGIIGYSLGMVRIYWLINACQLVVVVIINIVFLPKYGPVASAYALIANEAVNIFVVLPMIIKKYLALTDVVNVQSK